MSLLDKQEVQDICTFVGTLHCTLEKGADLYVNERQKMRHYRARSAEERRRKKECQIAIFTLRGAYVNLRYISMLYIHSFDCKSAIEHNGGV